MKTRFGIFGPWGQICKLCKRTVCAKCYSKVRKTNSNHRSLMILRLMFLLKAFVILQLNDNNEVVVLMNQRVLLK